MHTYPCIHAFAISCMHMLSTTCAHLANDHCFGACMYVCMLLLLLPLVVYVFFSASPAGLQANFKSDSPDHAPDMAVVFRGALSGAFDEM